MTSTRRRFLETSVLAAPAASLIVHAQGSERPATRAVLSFSDPWIEIKADHLKHNVDAISTHVSGRPILAVIKNNAYGMGLTEAARLLEPLSAVAGFAVVKTHEAMTLRDRGIRKPILLMGPVDDTNLAEIATRDIMPMVYTPIGRSLDRIAVALGRPVPIHVCVDTGLGRVGVPYREAASLIRDLNSRKGVRIDGMMMTFSEDPGLDREQISRFDALAADLKTSGVRFGRRHAASSYTLFQQPGAFFDMVRPGMAIYGVYSEQEFRTAGILDLRPALALRTRVVYVKQLRAGESAGYSRAYIAKNDVWIATLPVGHTDGWPRVAAKGARVRIGGALYPVIASVSASHTIVEIGGERQVNIGDVATLWDWEPGSRPEDVSQSCGASVYDLTMHLNPLLPKL